MSTVSLIFDFLSQHNCFSIDRREVSSYNFSVLRRNLRMIIKNLHEGDAYAVEVSDTLRASLSEWLTVPVPFDETMVGGIRILGKPEAVGARWGRDIMEAYEAALDAVTELGQSENPIRCEIRHVISELTDSGKKFRIFCHRLARPRFESIMQLPHQSDGLYIHTAKDYRESTPFDVLIKVGPLRSRGWGSCPDALLTAPRFETLVHFVWSGCLDEQGFGFDPVTRSAVIGETDSRKPSKDETSEVSWRSTTRKTGDSRDEKGLSLIDEDEFAVFETIAKGSDKHSAILVQIDEQHGILFPTRAQVLSFDPFCDESDRVGHRLPEEELEGMFVIFPLLEDVDLGEFHAKDGRLSPTWKQRLAEALKKDRDGLCDKLFARGIELLCLHSRVKDWCKAPTTVIPAPKKVEHFRALIDVLGIDFEQRDERKRLEWWKYAWREIRRSRGEAISEGRAEQETLEEKVEEILNVLQARIVDNCKRENDFIIPIPQDVELRGSFRFCRVVSVEEGFRAPDAVLRVISNLKELEQWRV